MSSSVQIPLQRPAPTNNQLGSRSDLLPRQMDGVMVSDTRSVRASEWKNSEREPGTTCSRSNHEGDHGRGRRGKDSRAVVTCFWMALLRRHRGLSLKLDTLVCINAFFRHSLWDLTQERWYLTDDAKQGRNFLCLMRRYRRRAGRD
jgi:hypothetical protein